MAVQNILKAIVKNIQREKEFPLWHGTGVSPQALMEGAESTTPKFSSKFFKQGTGGMVQGPGLYATEIVPVGKHYAELTGNISSEFRGGASYLDSVNNLNVGKLARIDAQNALREIHPHLNNQVKSPAKFVHDKHLVINAIDDKSFFHKQRAFEYKDSTEHQYADDYRKVKDFLTDIKYSDFKLDKNRYLYRVAFPKERYLDWYQPDKGSTDVINAFNKISAGRADIEPRLALSGGNVLQLIKSHAREIYHNEHRPSLEEMADLYSQDKVKALAFKLNRVNSGFEADKFADKTLLEAFEKAGFAGTKYRGDQQKGDFFNYVLQKPERARILDAFKFGVAGASLAPSFFSQPKVQTGRKN